MQQFINRNNSYDYVIKYTGEFALTTVYSKPIYTGYARTHTPKRGENRTMANEQNIKRAKRNVYDIVNCNVTKHTKMLTLTYAKTQLDYDRLYIDFKIFLQHLKRKGFEFPYLAVTEHQTKRGKKEGNAGSLHLHVLIFSDTYIPFDTLKRAWSAKGSVHVQKIERAKNKGAYVAKYITKEGAPPDKKSYRTSRNIKRPTFKAGLGGEIESVEALGFEWKHLNHSQYTVTRGVNQAIGEIVPDLMAEVDYYTKFGKEG